MIPKDKQYGEPTVCIGGTKHGDWIRVPLSWEGFKVFYGKHDGICSYRRTYVVTSLGEDTVWRAGSLHGVPDSVVVDMVQEARRVAELPGVVQEVGQGIEVRAAIRKQAEELEAATRIEESDRWKGRT